MSRKHKIIQAVANYCRKHAMPRCTVFCGGLKIQDATGIPEHEVQRIGKRLVADGLLNGQPLHKSKPDGEFVFWPK